MAIPGLTKVAGDAGAFTVTPTGGTKTTVPSILVSLDPSAAGFASAFQALLNAAAASLPTDQPTASGVVWNNGGVISIS